MIADTIYTGISSAKQHHPEKWAFVFVKAREKPQAQPRVQGGLLVTAGDWQLKGDLGRQLNFPDTIAWS